MTGRFATAIRGYGGDVFGRLYLQFRLYFDELYDPDYEPEK